MALKLKPGEALLIKTAPPATPTGPITYTVTISHKSKKIVDAVTLKKSPESFALAPPGIHKVRVTAAKASGPKRNATVTVCSASSEGDSLTKLVDETPREFTFYVVQS